MAHLFGTDGVRGIPGHYPLVEGTVAELAAAAAGLLAVPGREPLVLIGRDTRDSGPAIGRWLAEGFAAAGCRTLDLGVMTTPAVAYLTPRLGALGGVVVSASHNPAKFNGIKFFTRDGYKMPPELEEAVERKLSPPGIARLRARGARCEDASALGRTYEDFLRSTFPSHLDLCGMRLIVDCAHGAAWRTAPEILRGLGAEVVTLGCAPDGRNINSGCGALYPARLQEAVRRHRAHCGMAFDGDADRVIFADEKGQLLDGDSLICFSAMRLLRQGLLRRSKVVLTVMSNFGLIKYLKGQGIEVVSVPVGDRNVTEAIDAEGLSLGGEASGHIIFRRFSSTGDGILTALQTLTALRESGLPLSSCRKLFQPLPQIIHNIPVENKIPLERLGGMGSVQRRCERELQGEGRVFVRYSGTEPLLRIMIEGPRRSHIEHMARRIAAAYLDETGQQERDR